MSGFSHSVHTLVVVGVIGDVCSNCAMFVTFITSFNSRVKCEVQEPNYRGQTLH